jgi:hypothetical protein
MECKSKKAKALLQETAPQTVNLQQDSQQQSRNAFVSEVGRVQKMVGHNVDARHMWRNV